MTTKQPPLKLRGVRSDLTIRLYVKDQFELRHPTEGMIQVHTIVVTDFRTRAYVTVRGQLSRPGYLPGGNQREIKYDIHDTKAPKCPAKVMRIIKQTEWLPMLPPPEEESGA